MKPAPLSAPGPAASAPEPPGRGPFWRSVGQVLGGAAIAQAIPVVGSLILARLFIPSQFGLFATWLGIATLAAVVLTGRYEMALSLEADGAPRRAAVAATLRVVAAGFAILVVGCAIVALTGLANGIPGAMVALFPCSAAALAATQTWQCWAAAEGRFRDLSLIRIGQSAGIIGAQILAGLLLPNATGLAAAHALGTASGVAIAMWRLPLAQPGGHSPRHGIERSDFLRRRRRFPMLALPSDAMNAATAQLPLFVITTRFGPEVAGYLALTMRTLGAPIALLGASVLDVFRRRAASSYETTGRCRSDYSDTFRILSLGTLVVLAVMIPFSEPLFVLAFGERWRMSGVIALWLLPLFALRFVASPLSYVFYVAGKQHVDLLWQTGLLAMTLSTLWLPDGYPAALKWYGAGYSAMYVVYLMLSYRFSGGARR